MNNNKLLFYNTFYNFAKNIIYGIFPYIFSNRVVLTPSRKETLTDRNICISKPKNYWFCRVGKKGLLYQVNCNNSETDVKKYNDSDYSKSMYFKIKNKK